MIDSVSGITLMLANSEVTLTNSADAENVKIINKSVNNKKIVHNFFILTS